MDLLLVALLLLAVVAVVLVALGVVRGGMAPVDGALPPPLAEPVSRPEDLDRARFALAVRGYRMDQVDAVLDEARDLLLAKDDEIARLRGLTQDPVATPRPAEDDTPVPVPAPVGGPVPDRSTDGRDSPSGERVERVPGRHVDPFATPSREDRP